jgi:type I restriction enzyme S subunit
MEEWKEYKLGEVCSRLKSGKGIKADSVFNTGKYPVIGGNGVRGYADESNFQGQAAVIGRQGAYCGNVRFFEGEAYMTEHAVVAVGNEFADTRFLACLLSLMHLGNLSAQSAQPGISVQTLSKQIVRLPSITYQKKVSAIIKSLDDKIEVNRQINDNLEQQGQALFEEYVMNPNKPRTQLLSDYAHINPTRTIAKGRAARCIEMSSLPTRGTFPNDWTFKEYNGGMKFQNGDTIMARITPCLENGKTAYINFLDDNEVAFGSTEYIVLSAQEGISPELLYFLARYDDFVSYAVAHMNGSSGRQRVAGNDIANYVMPEITTEAMDVISEKLHGIMEVIKNNSLESRRLAEIRDTLLPRLMSGEIKLEEANM